MRLLAILPMLVSIAGAQEIADTAWGFDGRVVPNRFNILRVLVHNTTNGPIDKHLQLHKSVTGRAIGAPIVERCFLARGQSRWLHFYPFVTSTAESWRLSWVAGDATGGPTRRLILGFGAIVLLEAEGIDEMRNRNPVLENSPARRRRLTDWVPRFPPEQMPATVTAMETLHRIVMDRSPNLSASQQLALLAWVAQGGQIHLLQHAKGYMRFEDELAVLNGTDYSQPFGKGLVVRHPFDREMLKERLLKDPPSVVFQGFRYRNLDYQAPVLANVLREQLTERAQLEENMPLLFALTLVYLALVGPVFYYLSRDHLSWPLGLAALTGVIAIATWSFNGLGARGYDEQAATRSWSFANHVSGTRYEVTRFANVFVTQGGDYAFPGTSDFDLFSSGQRFEQIRGEIRNGRNAMYRVDMPPYSNRLIVHKSTVDGPDAAFTHTGNRLRTALRCDRILSLTRHFVITWRHRGGVQWEAGDTTFLADWVDRNPRRGFGIALEDVIFDQLQLGHIDLENPVTDAAHTIFFCEVETPPAFHLEIRAPDGARAPELGRTVIRFDTFSDRR